MMICVRPPKILTLAVFVSFSAALLLLAFAQDSASTDDTVQCHALDKDNYTCANCIQMHPKCAWCSTTVWKKYRCDTFDRLRDASCLDIEYPVSKTEVIKKDQLSNTQTDPESAVQMYPQEISLTLRPKEKVTIPITFRQAVDYPVDLYYLMDMSRSMTDDKDKLSLLGDLIAERMRAITRNFRLGFGSFVDKKVMPFVDARPEFANAPCSGCVPPYGFRHQMTLSTETQQFSREVDSTSVSGNLDTPEGSFDAVMQALVCEQEIGWRNKSRKMVVLSTDAGFHYAGDGRLAGIVMPNDGNCHLDSRGYYTMSTEQDYPSVAQLHQKIREMKANLIFAVTSDQVPLYTHLQAALPDVSTSVGMLANDSSNIVDLIQNEYEKISEKILMVDDSEYPVKISYKTKCLGSTWEDTNVCDGIKVGDEVTYNVTIEVEECTDKRHFDINIGPSGLTDVLKVDLRVLCNCDCETERADRKNSPGDPECNGKGHLVCGVCECMDPYRGRKCECNMPGMSTAELDNQCRKDNNPRAPLCENRGVCECGVCKCKTRENPLEIISGDYCECDNFNCPRHNRKICNGHGTCKCKECMCEPGWTGRACECSTSEEDCIASNGLMCNGKGSCQCGICHCFDDEERIRYSGPTCESCPTCPDKCNELKPCVQCKQWGTGPNKDDDTCDECHFIPISVSELPSKNETDDHCQAVDKTDGCTFYWAFVAANDGTKNVTVYAKDKKKCPPPVPVLAIVLGVIASIVVIGLLLLFLWKILTIIHDRREFAKFYEESKRAKWDTGENPIFNPATTTFRNPAYGGKSM